MKENFAIALSEKNGEAAIREISLKIKSVFPKLTKYIFVIATPHYNPKEILKTVNFTLRPKIILILQTPFLIFDDNILQKGIGACCINKESARLKEILIDSNETQEIEAAFRNSFKSLPKEKRFIFSLITNKFDPVNFLRGVELSLGEFFPLFGGGYLQNYPAHNYKIITGQTNNDHLVNILGQGLEIHPLKIEGFLPLGKPFTINRVIKGKGIILEINKNPAIDIYKYYLEEKFEAFKKNRLFNLYPLGIKEDETIRLLDVIDCLEDGSLVCAGEVKENCQAHIMILHQPTLLAGLAGKLKDLKKDKQGLLFMINSLSRKKILKAGALEEIKLIKSCLGRDIKIIGAYSDYSFFPNSIARRIDFESGNISLLLWK